MQVADMLIIGSHALIAHGVRLGRIPSDVDAIATMDEINDFRDRLREKNISFHVDDSRLKKIIIHLHVRGAKPIEFEISDPIENPTGWELKRTDRARFTEFRDKLLNDLFGVVRFADPNVVLTLKLSHRYLKNNPHFRKTMDDILALRGLGYSVPPELQDWFKRREKATYYYKHPSLERNKKQFFSGDGVEYKYEHDDIHAALATLPDPDWPFCMDEDMQKTSPAYKYFQADGAEVKTDKKKFFDLPTHVKLLSVLEESYVLALERSQIPCNFEIAPRTSFLIALEKVCTSITSGWWREYAWEHYYQVLAMYNDDYVARFIKAEAEGRVRLYQGNKELVS
jgi:hypothetical protein